MYSNLSRISQSVETPLTREKPDIEFGTSSKEESWQTDVCKTATLNNQGKNVLEGVARRKLEEDNALIVLNSTRCQSLSLTMGRFGVSHI